MSLIKSYGIGHGDMFYIRHNSDNFTIIDCCIPEDRRANILPELATQSDDKNNVRFISTHPDQDHIGGLVELDDHLGIRNFYTVKNKAKKEKPTADFLRYVELRDSDKAYYLHKGCKRKWMNVSDDRRKTSGINILWPDTTNLHFRTALAIAAIGLSPNNISPIITYSHEGGAKVMWMGDLETDFMTKIEEAVSLPRVDVLFAPHHGRASGRVPASWLRKLQPQLIVVGEAPSAHLNYYPGYNTITQNTAGDVLFDCRGGRTDIYVNDVAYQVNFLHDDGFDRLHGLYYIGSLHH